MPSSDDLTAAPLYLELAPPADAAAQVDHLYVFRDTGALSGRGSGRFATDLFALSVTHEVDGDGARVSLAPPRPDFTPRETPFCGIVAGLRLASRPERLPEAQTLEQLTARLERVWHGDDDLPLLISALDDIARQLSFALPPQTFSDRTERRKTLAQTGVSRRRLTATRRFRLLLESLAGPAPQLSDLALDAGYYDQSHMAAFCRAFAGKSPGALRAQAAPRQFGHSLQDTRLKDRLRLVINE